jgi:hypothetical protein
MMCKDPDERFSAAEIREHPWIKGGGAGEHHVNNKHLKAHTSNAAKVC